MNENRITLEFDDGVELETEIMGTFDLNGVEYIALAEVDGNDVYLYRYISTEEGFEVEDIPEDEFDAVAKEFDAIMEGLEN